MSIRKDKQFMTLLREYHRLIHNIIPGASCVLDIMNKQDELINYIDNYLDEVVIKKEAELVDNDLRDLVRRMNDGSIFL